MDFDLDKHTIFKTLTGSRVYGTSTPESDYDHRGVAIPPLRYFLSSSDDFGQAEDKVNDTTIFNLNKFVTLAADNNPNIIELLYIPRKYWTVTTPQWEQLVAHRDYFLSKKAYYTFTGYAHSQLRRLRTHRHWLQKGELEKPHRADYGLKDKREIPKDVWQTANALVERYLARSSVEENLSQINKTDAMALRYEMQIYLETTLALTKMEIEDHTWTAAGKALGFDDNLMDVLKREKEYQKASKEYKSWLNWKKTRNPKRQALEAKCGFDAKHASHLVRLLKMCEEILTDHTVVVERPDADVLTDIREGNWPYERLEQWYEKKAVELKALYESSTLQHKPNRKAIKKLEIEIIADYFGLGVRAKSSER